jgi:LuxR family maltose regulon positive regulatory protein
MSAVPLRLAELPAEVFAAAPGPLRTPERGLVDRPRLARRLVTSTAPIVLLVAPAGYGKSALLAQWQARDERPFAWAPLPARPTARGGAIAAIGAALHGVGALDDVGATSALALAEAWAAAAVPHVLVLDGADVLDDDAGAELLGLLADHVPAGSALAVASRSEPRLAVGRLRTDDAVLELRGADLVMTDREAALVLRRVGLRLDPEDAVALARATEGWPAALHLAGLALREQRDLGAAVTRFAGDDRIVADYVEDTLLCRLAPDDLSLLERTAPLDRLSGRLCDAVLDRRGTGRALRRLSRAGLPFTALDRSEEQFRVHPLVSAALRARLRRDDPAVELEVHRRASRWHEQQGELAEALDHAITAGDADRAASLLWRAVPTFAGQSPTRSVERWLDRLDEEQIAARPVLALALATTRVARGDRDVAERWLATAQRALDGAPGAAPPQVLGAVLAVRAAIGREGIAQTAHDAARARSMAEPDSVWFAVSCFLEGAALHLLGDVDAAAERLDEGARCAGAAAAPSIRVLCLAQSSVLAFERGDRDTGTELAARAGDEVARSGLADEPGSALAFAVSAFAHAHDGPVDAARVAMAEARRLLGSVGDGSPWFEAEVRVVLARAELRLSDAAAARVLLVEASRALRPVPETTAVHAWIDDTWERADTFAAGAVGGPSTLTTAELRVLRFLPSHLSFREIAARLHVSANTVKTQAHAVYRKLYASSRSEAVARAREVGLIDG